MNALRLVALKLRFNRGIVTGTYTSISARTANWNGKPYDFVPKPRPHNSSPASH